MSARDPEEMRRAHLEVGLMLSSTGKSATSGGLGSLELSRRRPASLSASVSLRMDSDEGVQATRDLPPTSTQSNSGVLSGPSSVELGDAQRQEVQGDDNPWLSSRSNKPSKGKPIVVPGPATWSSPVSPRLQEKIPSTSAPAEAGKKVDRKRKALDAATTSAASAEAVKEEKDKKDDTQPPPPRAPLLMQKSQVKLASMPKERWVNRTLIDRWIW